MHVPLVVKGKLGKTSKRLKILWKWLQVFLLRELAGYESGFLGKQSPLTILFCLHLLPSKQFLVFKTSWRRLQDVFSVTIFRLWGRLLKTSWKTKNGYTEDVLEINKMFIGISLSNHGLLTNLNQYLTNLYLTNLYFTNLRRIQIALIRTQLH